MTFPSNVQRGGLDHSQSLKSRVPRLHWIYHLRLARLIVRSTFRVSNFPSPGIVSWDLPMYALNLNGDTMGFLITKSNAFVMLGATRALMSYEWSGRDMINLTTVGLHGLPCYRMSHTWYMRLRLTHQCSNLARALLSVLPQQCVTVCGTASTSTASRATSPSSSSECYGCSKTQ